MSHDFYRAHKTKKYRKGSKVPKKRFKPDHNFCQNAVDEYLEKGGKITQIFIEPGDDVKKFPDDLMDE